MDQATLVGNQIEDASRLIEQLRQDNFDIAAAFWVKTADDGQWFLYIASDAVDKLGLSNAYRAVLRTIGRMPDLWIDPLDVKLISPAKPMARDVVKIQKDYAKTIPTRYRGSQLGKVSIENAYIYPPIAPS